MTRAAQERAAGRPRGGRRALLAAAAGCAVALVPLACSSSPEPGPDRSGDAVVTVGAPFGSLNAGTPEGRLPGSVLVRGLVQDGFVALDATGAAVMDPVFGTVEKTSDDPLTVRYTVGPDVRWSDGTPVTAADLLLEWAARSGALDEVAPELGEDGEVVNRDALDAGVAFAATSRALVHVQAVPAVDDEGRVTLRYAQPVADWQVALDVNLPAHVLGRTALGVEDAQEAAEAVVAAVTAPAEHHDDLVALSRTWRTAFDEDALAASAADAVTTGPYAVAAVTAGGVELVRNEHYAGSRPARFDSVRVRTDLHPLDQVEALASGEVDVVAPVATEDVRDALTDAEADVVTGGDAAWQLVAQTAGTGPLAGADRAPAVRRALWLTVPREQVVTDVVAPLWPDAVVDTAVLATVGEGAGGAVATARPDPDSAATLLADAGVDTPVAVRVLANTTDPLREQTVALLTDAARAAGLELTASTADPTTALWAEPDAWDVALVPTVQDELPVASLVGRWGTDGTSNVTGWSDEATDAALAALAAQTDPAGLAAGQATLAARLVEAGAVLPLVHAPALTATRAEPAEGAPRVGEVPLLRLSRADLTDWWSWATQA
ncbi:ABC transporter substrate-binding protein [Cellulomonas palmilytica]|uniref:ABC transporter substrate-binding protein n=1 Tax=Cellulomonas palmilytica TaxID=2608402 RepID=UPI001F38F7E5|nr:ABC transporter substrate-binding protein [Cellulomonas palmilytica]UJP41216.1 hypothetical protein F1D97_07200 [Cellulomonas palmilytica]